MGDLWLVLGAIIVLVGVTEIRAYKSKKMLRVAGDACVSQAKEIVECLQSEGCGLKLRNGRH